MRKNRGDYDRRRGDSPDWERRSRERKNNKNWEREPIDLPERKKDNYKGHQGTPHKQETPRLMPETVAKINRKEMSPFLVRIFYSINKENIFGNNGSLPES